MNENLASKISHICVAYMDVGEGREQERKLRLHGQGLLLQPYCISTMHGGHVGEGSTTTWK